MSSLPSVSHMSLAPNQSARRSHRHKRSGAVSGDFDIVGLGLFGAPPTNSREGRHLSTSSTPQAQPAEVNSFHHKLFSGLFVPPTDISPDQAQLDRFFKFSNENDFANTPHKEEFMFPSKGADLDSMSASPRMLSATRRGFSGLSSNLNSPIRLKPKTSRPSFNLTPKLFMTEETVFNDENIPDAVIDLDEILNASSHAGDRPEIGGVELHKFSSPKDDDLFLFLNTRIGLSVVHHGSPYSSPAYLKQMIREPVTDAIEEEEDMEEYKLAEEEITTLRSGEATVGEIDDSSDIKDFEHFANPQNAFHGIYTTMSANSSSSSLQANLLIAQRTSSAPLLEKTSSISSKDSNMSTFANASTPTSKRSSAMATRYQSFYDQSFKISSALKFSSTDSVHLVKSNSNGDSGAGEFPASNNLNLLGHSSSLPSLKSNIKRPIPMTLADVRFMRDPKSNYTTLNNATKISPHDPQGRPCGQRPQSPPARPHLETNLQQECKSVGPCIAVSKNLSNSASSKASNSSSTVSSGGNISPDQFALASHVDTLPLATKPPTYRTRSTTPIIVVSMEQDGLSLASTPSPAKLSSSEEQYRGKASHHVQSIVPATTITSFKEQSGLDRSTVEHVGTFHHDGSKGEANRDPSSSPSTDGDQKSKSKNTRRKAERLSGWFRRRK